MNVLIVNCFSQNPKGILAFSASQILLRKLFQEETLLIDNHIQYLVRSFDDLSDFIYEANSNHQLKESLKNFNSLDMIFVLGQQNMTPWDPLASQLLILLRMCWLKQKICFVSQFGFICNLFIANMNFEQNISIINGNHGGSLSEIYLAGNKDNKKYNDDSNSYFLDNITGDLYKYRGESLEWQYTGMYLRKSAGQFQTIGNISYRVPVNQISKQSIPQTERSNLKLPIRVLKRNHWAMEHVSSEFDAKIHLDWELNTKHALPANRSYEVLVSFQMKALCDLSPAIMTINDYQLGLLFELNQFVAQSIQIVKNFIKHQISNLIITRKPEEKEQISAHSENSGYPKVKISVDTKISQEFPRISHQTRSKDSNKKKTCQKSETHEQLTKNGENSKQNIIQDFPRKKIEIRAFLHPNINQDNLLNKSVWVPGNLQPMKRAQKPQNPFQLYF